MSWKLINKRKVLRELMTASSRVGSRFVMLDPANVCEVASIAQQNDPRQLCRVECGQLYELVAAATNPPAALVVDASGGGIIGAYVWSGGGGQMTTTRDPRLAELGTLLDQDYRRRISA
ncbi:MAG TPA: hypothetical protein VNT52_18170 [Acidimicrobiales bacterium]|jgi:hypothetical protein|nr:hypothetical protein [Acidimicrobiales bacterium]